MKNKCNSCLYSTPVDMGEDCQMLRGCLYILIRHERRPCKGGEGCTAYEPAGRRRREQWL